MIYRFNDLVKKLKSDNSRLSKEAFLKEYKDDEGVKSILYFLFNPYIVTGISDAKLNKWKDHNFVNTDELRDIDFQKEILDFIKNNNTGSDNIVKTLVSTAQCYQNKEIEDLIYSIIKKDLLLGVQATTVNKIIGKGFIPQFSVMLAEKYYDNPEEYLPQGTKFIITKKLDGMRCVLIFDENGNTKFFSRNGQPIENMVELEEECKHLNPNFVYDGELLKDEEHEDSADLYRATMKITGSDKIKKEIVFNIFDCIQKKGFEKAEENKDKLADKTPCYMRKLIANEHIKQANQPHIKEVETLYVGEDQSQIELWMDRMKKDNEEGIMINIYDAPYQCKRTEGLLKVKKFKECEVVITGLEEGRNEDAGMLGAFHAKIKSEVDGNWYNIRCGSGLKKDMQALYWPKRPIFDANGNKIGTENNPDFIDLVGKVAEIKYFEVSKNQNDDGISLRFPVWLDRVRNDKTEGTVTPVK